ncbi:MAG: hypothetical protein HYR55_04655 [Acidobacteria bacterium]|nr:hypothetical protein [Acidobacteriota bacterium]MBI3654868.1 hypothetical protein [Acidobacteriota bacterium]
MQLRRGLFALAILGALSGAVWAQKSNADEKTKLIIFVAKLFNVDKKTVDVSAVKPSTLVKGSREAVVSIGANTVTVYLIGDKMIIGNTYDKDYDPLKAIMAKLTLKGRPTKGKGPITIAEFSEFQ